MIIPARSKRGNKFHFKTTSDKTFESLEALKSKVFHEVTSNWCQSGRDNSCSLNCTSFVDMYYSGAGGNRNGRTSWLENLLSNRATPLYSGQNLCETIASSVSAFDFLATRALIYKYIVWFVQLVQCMWWGGVPVLINGGSC